jgi:murein L,D-transpeptidase YafK
VKARVFKSFAALILASIVTVTAFADPLPPNVADRVVIEKAQRRLTLFNHGALIRTYSVALGIHPVGPKEQLADGRTPEGRYVIDGRNADSDYHKALHISYPNADDQARATAKGVQPGGDIMIHGLRNGLGWLGSTHRLFDWTNGCIAVTDSEIDEIWRLVPDGAAVEIMP